MNSTLPRYSSSGRQFIVGLALLVSAAAATQLNAAPPQSSSGKPAAYPLKLSANRRYLVDQNNTPFLIVGDTPQGLMGRLTEAQAERYFADRQAHGFNTMGWI